MAVSSCPGPLVWQKYVLGLVEEVEQQALEAHLANCPTCLERLRRLPAEDTLVDDLRGGLTVADEPRWTR
jgi:anti-sigma factor RsiW